MSAQTLTSRRDMRVRTSPVAERAGRVLRALTKIADKALTVIALVSVVVVLGSIASALGIITPLVVTSNSMTPTFAAGDLIIARTVSVEEVKVGDVATVPRADGVLVTHRVSRVLPSTEGTALAMKGDANESEDHEIYQADEVRVPLVIIPYVGWVVASLSNLKFIIASVCATVMFIVLVWFPGKTKKSKHAK